MTAAPHVSASSLRLLSDCPRAWWFRYAAGHPSESQAASTVIGRGVHVSLSRWYEALRDGRPLPSLGDLSDAAERVIAELCQGPIPIEYDQGEDPHALASEAARLLSAFVASPYLPRRVIAVEEPFTLAVEQHPGTAEVLDVDERVTGVFDLVAENEAGELVVVDHKTGKRRPTCEGGFDLQGALYGWAARRIYGRPPRLFHQVLLRTKVAAVELHEMPTNHTWEAEAIDAVLSGIALVQVAVEHPRPLRLMARRRSWRCAGCNYNQRCADERA